MQDYRRNRLTILIPLLPLLVGILACSLPGVDNNSVGSYVESGVTSTQRPTPTRLVSSTPTKTPTSTATVTSTQRVVLITSTPVATSRVVITGEVMEYTVRRGDSLYRIAKTQCGDPRQYLWLARVNGIGLGDTLRVGQILKVNCR